MKLYIITLGCPKNFNDSEGIGGIWEKAGMTIAEGMEEADAILINTCGFINDAKKESIERIFDVADYIESYVKEYPESDKKILIVSGCLSQRYADELYEEMPEVDIFLGVNEYEKLPDIIGDYTGGNRLVRRNQHPGEFVEFSSRRLEANPYSATLRIAEGCNNSCAYCVIPQIRGGYRSRPVEKIMDEAEKLASAGCKELILIAQDVTEYGRDIYGKLKLPELLKGLCRVEGIKWIRLMYCYEHKITDELIEVMASEEKICHYIDIPLQHVSDNVLASMNRFSTRESIENTIGRLRAAMEDIHIRTTFIVGFPGESEDDFNELEEFVQKTRLDRLGVFAYSREEGTPAGEMENQIDENVKQQRVDRIMRAQIEISGELNRRKIGETISVIVDDEEDVKTYIGRTQYDAPEIDNAVIFTSDRELRPGEIVTVRITDAFDYDLVGNVEG